VSATDPAPVERSTATETTSPTPKSDDSKKDSPHEKRKMKAALDEFLAPD
jgi:hypothetical protein